MRAFTAPVALSVALTALLAVAAWAGPAKVEPKDQKTTDSGLKYAVLKPGTGPGAIDHQEVTVHYTGWLESGKQFDSSRDRNQPITVVLGSKRLIPGFEEGLKGMAAGEQRQLVIPPKLGYGDRSVGNGLIPANSTLIFEIEVVKLGDVLESNDAPAKVDSKNFKSLKGGLKYAVLKEGSGDEAVKGKTVTVHYTGWLKSGKKFDSSLDRGEPFKFPLGAGQVIPGWDQGVQGMKVGEKRQLQIPAKLAYGEAGAGGVIPPNADLIFEVQLLAVGK